MGVSSVRLVFIRVVFLRHVSGVGQRSDLLTSSGLLSAILKHENCKVKNKKSINARFVRYCTFSLSDLHSCTVTAVLCFVLLSLINFVVYEKLKIIVCNEVVQRRRAL